MFALLKALARARKMFALLKALPRANLCSRKKRWILCPDGGTFKKGEIASKRGKLRGLQTMF